MRALGQKYMGIRPGKHSEEMFRTTADDMTIGGGHAIPVSVINSNSASVTLLANLIGCRTFLMHNVRLTIQIWDNRVPMLMTLRFL